MKRQLLVVAFVLAGISWSYGQITSNEYEMNRGYLRLGISNLGKELQNDLSGMSPHTGDAFDDNASMIDNLLDGRFGAKTGYVVEFGRNYYFNRTSLLPLFDTKIGLDWTHLSVTYNKLDWSGFIERDRAAGYEVDEMGFFAVSLASKVGPVISFNFIDRLVLDIRGQLAATYFVNGLEYMAYTDADDRYLTFMVADEEDHEIDGLKAFGKLGKFGIKQNYGATLRYGAIGVAVDYFPGSFKYEYETQDADGMMRTGEDKFKNNVFQVKLSLTL